MKRRIGCSMVAFLSLTLSLAGQISGASSASAQVPPLIQFSGAATDEGGNVLSGDLAITFSLYPSPQGGQALWSETQNVQLDRDGHYAVQLGVTKPNGVPPTLFSAAQARWLAVEIAGQTDQPRVLLVSVPYALKAGDAATIGGLPPSAFVLAAPPMGSGQNFPLPTDATTAPVEPQSAPPAGAVTGSGTTDFIPLWTSGSVLGNSVLFQTGSGTAGKVGINTTTPATALDVKGGGTIRGTLGLPATGNAMASSGRNSQPINLTASAFNSSTKTPVNQAFTLQSEPSGNDTASPTGTLNLLFGSGGGTPAETGLNINNKGQITFAPGQVLPAPDVAGDLGATGNITSFGCNCLISASNGTFSGNVSAGGTSFFGNISASGSLSAASASITGGIVAGSIGTAGDGSFGNVSGFQATFASSGTFQTLDLQNFATPANNVFVEAQFNNATKAIVWTDALGDFNAVGTKSAVVPAQDGSMVKLFAVESPEVWFDDYGSGRLNHGAATISLDPGFAQTVNTSTAYHVFLTPKGDCKGLYVTNETATGFEVKELGGGASGVAFDYRIVALRKGYENVRLPLTEVPKPATTGALRRVK